MADKEPEQETRSAPTGIARKITTPAVTGKKADDIAVIGRAGKTALYHLIGVAGDVKVVNTVHGESVGVLGNFQAVNIETGEVFYSGTAYPPPFIAYQLKAQIAKSEGAPVEFAITVGVQPANNRFGYEYYAETHIDPKKDARMETLMKALPPLPRRLAAPAAKK